MNPHFISNALTAIQKTIFDNDPIKSAYYLSKFAKLIRQNFEFVSQKEIHLSEDLYALKNYIETQQLRFENKFDYNIIIDASYIKILEHAIDIFKKRLDLRKMDENYCVEKTIAFEIIITRFKAPKYFTPNNDGYNDYWQVLDVDNTLKQIQIFDRYGKLIKQIDPNSVGWDGTYNSTPLPTNDYWYLINLHTGNTIRGHFTLKR